jgi:biopolymer transport protein ExbB
MARHGSSKKVWAGINGSPGHKATVGLIGLALLILTLAVPALAQDAPAAETPQGPPKAEIPTSTRIEKVMAPSDSLAFGKTPADSANLVPVYIEPLGGMMGVLERSPLGKTGLGETFIKGGVFMWWLLVIAIYGMVFVIERFWTLHRAKINTRRLIGTVVTTLKTEGVQAAAEECQKWRGPIAAILYSGLQKADKGDEAIEKAISTAGVIEMSFLERGLVWVSSVTTMGPLVGFLGTVSGMIHAFEAIAASEQVSAKLVASGISEALITTAAGLILAIPASMAYNFFVATIDRFTIEMEEAAMELMETLHTLR